MLRGRFLFPEFHPLHGAARTATLSFFEYIRETSRSMACAPWSRARSRISAVTFGGTAVSAGPDFHADDEAAPYIGSSRCASVGPRVETQVVPGCEALRAMYTAETNATMTKTLAPKSSR